MDNITIKALTPDDAARWDAINKRVLDIIYSPVAPTETESDLVWLARRFVDAQRGSVPAQGGDKPCP